MDFHVQEIFNYINKYINYIIIKILKMSDNPKEINKIKAEIMYDEIIIKYEYIKNIDNEENIINKIIELNFDENKIKEYYEQKFFDDLFGERDNYGGIFDDFGDENNKSSIINKIKELHFDRELINQWIENFLIGEESL